MATALESAGLVRQKCRAITRNPAIFYALKGFFLHWASNNKNADLQWVPFDNADIDAAGGYDTGIDAACTVYVFYAKKTNTAEDAYVYLFDDATDDAGAGTDGRANLVLLGANDEAVAIYPNGLPMTAGIVVKSYTDFDGTTDTTAGSAADGFVIIGA